MRSVTLMSYEVTKAHGIVGAVAVALAVAAAVAFTVAAAAPAYGSRW